jgi:hypothetical protein
VTERRSPELYDVDQYGMFTPRVDTSGMTCPAICCHCGSTVDLGAATVTGRYADCTVFTLPCCGFKGADDRQHKGLLDVRLLRR